jgi:hypothetical protein
LFCLPVGLWDSDSFFFMNFCFHTYTMTDSEEG